MNVRISQGAGTAVPDAVVTALREVVSAKHVVVDDGVRTDAGQDFWPITLIWVHAGQQPALPALVVRPQTSDQVARVLAIANDARIPVTPFAGRSGVCGGSLPAAGGISLDVQGLKRIVEINQHDLMVQVEAGVYGPKLEEALQAHGLTVGHFPQSFEISTVGGWIACRGAGQYSNRYGKIEDMVLGLEVALADGTLLRTNPQPASATGPDLKQLFIGAEGTLGVITSAWLQLWPRPAHSQLAAYTFDRFADTLEVQRLVLQRDASPAVLRSYDARDAELHFKKIGVEDGRSVLLAIAEGEPAEVERQIGILNETVAGYGAAARSEDVALTELWLKNRNDVSGLEVAIRRGLVVDTIEVGAPWSKLVGVYEAVRAAVGAVKGTLAVAAHASHAYLSGGCLYFTFAGAPGDSLEAKDAFYNAAWDAAMAAVTAHGGTISHHHGIGLNRARFMPAELGAGMDVLRRMKAALDPHGILNPGKLGLGPATWPHGRDGGE
jgi:alkyldihydroxyacetonephosphate synthase